MREGINNFFLDFVLYNGGVRSPKLLKFFETFPESKTMLLSQETLPVCNIDGSDGDAKVAKKNDGGRNKQCKDIVVVEETSNSLLR